MTFEFPIADSYQAPAPTYQPAPFFRRLGARILDLLFCLALTFALAIPVSIPGFIAVNLLGERWEPLIIQVIVVVCYFSAYVGLEVFLLVRREGQTLGKGLMGLRVVRSNSWARPQLAPLPALIRMLIIFLPFVAMSVAGSYEDVAVLNAIGTVGLLSLFASLVLIAVPVSGRFAVHDYAARTRVVRAAKRKIDWKRDIPMVLPGKLDVRQAAH